jgi:amino acid adenylation domain-containing protein
MPNYHDPSMASASQLPVAEPESLPAEEVFPLSLQQEGVWFLEQLAPGQTAYNLCEAWDLHGQVDREALQQALDTLVRRHESLRTIFGTRDGQPVQLVLPQRPFALRFLDLSKRCEQAEGLGAWMTTESQRHFDLLRGPLARAILFRLEQDRHVLLLNLHHLISDEWSMGIFLRELGEHYSAFLERRELLVQELPIQYGDFALWQREVLMEQSFEPQLEYWRKTLRGPLPALRLPEGKPGPAADSPRGAAQFSTIPKVLVDQLKDLSRAQGVTLFMTLLAGFNTLLHRYTREHDVVVGSPMAGRERTETEGVIGFFVNTHAFRTDLSGDPTFLELLGRVREVVVAACAHQEVSLERIIERLQPERQGLRHPVIQMVFGLQPATNQEWQIPGLKGTRIELDNGGAKFDWTLLLTENDAGLRVRSEYSTEIYDADTVSRAVHHYSTLLQAIAENPGQRISELRLLTPAERVQIIRQSTGRDGHGSSSLCLQGLFEAQVTRAPAATAVVLGQDQLTYGELNTRANQLARRLRALGVGPDVPVALRLGRSPRMIVAILGVLKAGGAYVPIDPAYPAERLAFLLEDTKAQLLITESELAQNTPVRTRNTICLGPGWDEIAGEAMTDLSGSVNPQNTAYIIYTSGSTGKPKGVLVSHRNVVRLLRQTEQWFGFHSEDVWSVFHSYAFDFSVWEIWGALAYGGRLVIVPVETARSPADFYMLLVKEKVTILNQTPSAFRQLMWAESNANPGPELSLRHIIFGGEALEFQSLRPWLERHGDANPVLVNMYGITETTVHVTYRRIRQSDLARNGVSLIGDPIPDLSLYLLDEHLEPVPVGIPGEICVGGAGVARGYLNRPELSRERFVPDPFSPFGGRMYRSGDLARRSVDGEIEYLGRIDHQVKIRGYRIELGEIESTLNSLPTVRESVVLARDNGGRDKCLAAYVVPASMPGPSPAELRDYLAEKLPDYLIPATFISIPNLPLTNNGKVDRNALLAQAPATSQAEVVQPRNETEERIAAAWCDVLGLKSVSVHENFFHLGGHSLLATQVVSRVSLALNREVSVRLLFEAPTVARLAEALARQESCPVRPVTISPQVDPSRADELLRRVGDLTEAEIDALLGELRVPSL